MTFDITFELGPDSGGKIWSFEKSFKNPLTFPVLHIRSWLIKGLFKGLFKGPNFSIRIGPPEAKLRDIACWLQMRIVTRNLRGFAETSPTFPVYLYTLLNSRITLTFNLFRRRTAWSHRIRLRSWAFVEVMMSSISKPRRWRTWLRECYAWLLIHFMIFIPITHCVHLYPFLIPFQHFPSSRWDGTGQVENLYRTPKHRLFEALRRYQLSLPLCG